MSLLRKVVGFFNAVAGQADGRKIDAVLAREPQVLRLFRKRAYRGRVRGLAPERRRRLKVGPTHYVPHCGCKPEWFASKHQFNAHSPERCIARKREAARG